MNLPFKHHILQLMQNFAARFISRTPCHAHITPILIQLQWVSITKLYQFNVLVITYKVLHQTTLMYTREPLNLYHPHPLSTRSLRSASTTTTLVHNRIKTIQYGRRLLDTSSAALWNILPENIKSANNIKTLQNFVC